MTTCTTPPSEARDYERYGDTCAGRQPEGTRVYCRDVVPELIGPAPLRRYRRSALAARR